MRVSLDSWLSRLCSHQFVDRSLKSRHVQMMIERLNLLPIRPKVISVAGTNGKGSCVAILESIYHAGGLRVGAFTSPHFLSFNERIRICQQEVCDEAICQAFSRIEKVRSDLQIGYFQFAFLAALILFQEANLDVIILEVGIGGLYDAVNAVDADLSIITQIGLDHCEILGNSLELIAKQKAGIMRINKPVVVGDDNPPAEIFHIANTLSSSLFCLKRDFNYQDNEQVWSWHFRENSLSDLPKPTLLLQNAATALMAIQSLQSELTISEDAIRIGLKNAQLQGRQQLVFYQSIPVLIDVAHNVDATMQLIKKVKALNILGKKHIVFGVRQDKDYPGMIKQLKACADYWHVSSFLHPRAATVKSVENALKKLKIAKKRSYSEPFDAFKGAVNAALPEDLIIICGSFLTAANILGRISGSIS